MSLLALEQAILERLAIIPELATLKLETYPDDPAEYISRNPRGAVLLAIAGSRYEMSFNGVQNRKTRIVITLLLRNLSTHQGVYALLDAITDALLGWTPDASITSGQSWCALTAVSEQYVARSSGVWQYDLVFETSRLAISAYNPCY